MEKIKKNIDLITYIFIAIIIIVVMFWAISKKEGFHEDEMFSYGASNSTLGNNYLSYGRIDCLDTVIKDKNPIITLKNLIYYRVLNKEKYAELENDFFISNNKSVWRNKEDAIEYLQIDNFVEAIDFCSVYWNTAKDVHPPLFYFMVHVVSILFWGSFSKYIIFIVNLVFFLGTIFILRRIFILIDKKYLSIPNLILYGASLGAISTVMFQRMYMMLTFFTIYLLYINIRIYLNNFELSKKDIIELITVTILGFLTQYNFCFYAVFLVLTMIVIAIIKKEYKKIGKYFLQYIKSAIIGVLLFLPSIYHIFFSYRGIGNTEIKMTLSESFVGFCKNVFYAYNLPVKFGIVLTFILTIVFAIKFCRSKYKDIYSILVIPTIFTFLMIVVISPYRSLRYIMNLLPIISMIFLILMDDLVENKKFSMIVLTIFATYISIAGILVGNIKYLYIGYNNYIDIAEKYKNDNYVLVGSTIFSHIQDVPEFQIYNKSLIISPEQLEELKYNVELENGEEFILGIKNWLDIPEDEILKKVMEYTNYNNYEMLYTSSKSANMTVYRIYK